MSAASARLDAELVRRGLARSRGRAAALVAQGRVRVGDVVARKASQPVPEAAALSIVPDEATEYVSRAAHKLAGALDAINALAPGALQPAGAWCLDAGASTGGFTQVLLERGAAHVVAVDVGHDQIAPVVAADPRVTVREGVNVRRLSPQDVGGPVDLVVADLSFISLTVVLPADLELRLDHEQEVPPWGDGRDERRQHNGQRDEREVRHHEVDRAADVLRAQPTDVDALPDGHAGIGGDDRSDLVVADVDGDDVSGAALEEHLGEAAGRGAGVETPGTRRLQRSGRQRGDGVQRAGKLVRGTGDVLGRLVRDDRERRRLRDGLGGLASDHIADPHPALRHQRGGAAARPSEAATDQLGIQPGRGCAHPSVSASRSARAAWTASTTTT